MRYLFSSSLVICLLSSVLLADDRPNILWLTCEDISPNLGCYGDDLAVTPQLDQLAKQGVRYTNAIGITGVCAVNRSCLITGMYSSSIGTQDMRSRADLPTHIKCFPEYLRTAGYYCTNNAKTDYNFPVPKNAWDASSGRAHWKNRKPNQPFFAVFNYVGTHESQIWEKNHQKHTATLEKHELHDPAKTPLPPFHPDLPETRCDWANYYDNISALDHWIGKRLNELDEANLTDDTIVVFFSDHGAGMPGVKKWIWEGGLRVPFFVRFPQRYRHLESGEPGTSTDRLISFVDFAPSVLSLCGIDIPEHMQGKPFLGQRAVPPRKVAHVIRDRMAERYEMIRGVRGIRYQYYRNFMPHLPWSQFTSYTEQMPTMQAWRAMHDRGQLNPVQDRYFQTKPLEELYDLKNDPHMITNLAMDPAYAQVVQTLRTTTQQWQITTRDLGLLPEFIMHQRSRDTTPYELAQQLGSSYFEKLCHVADQATQRDTANIEKLVRGTQDADDAVRWWSVMGLVMLGRQASTVENALVECLDDESPIVRIAAAEALSNLGLYNQSVPVLTAALAHETPFVRLRAINALDRIDEHAIPAIELMQRATMPKGTIFPADYLNRMCEYLPAQLQPSRAENDQPRCDSWVDLYLGEPVSYEDVLEDLQGVRVVYLGECHALKRHHTIQERIVHDLAQAGKPLVLALEQMEQYQQPSLDQYNQGKITFDQLAAATKWAERWGNYQEYRAIVETARKSGTPIVALNARSETIRQVARKQGVAGISAEERSELPPDLQLNEPLYETLLNMQLMVHMSVTADKLRPIREAQMCRDEKMASVLCDYLQSPEGQERTAIVLCGAGHISYGLGTVSRVRRRMPNIKNRIIVLSQSGDLELTPAEKAMAREINITHEQLRVIDRPIADYLHVRSLTP